MSIFNTMTLPDHQNILKDHPFLSFLTYGGNEYIGIVQNLDDVITSIYDFGALKTDQEKLTFLELGETWWWESNRLVPINIFLKSDWLQFRYTLKTFNSKDVALKYGPAISLKETISRKSKRRSIILVRRV
jgi:hypothetical protein